MAVRRLPLLLAVSLATACRLGRPTPPTSVATDPPPLAETREVQLDDDFITVRLHIPPTPEARKPTVIWMLGDRSALLGQGMLVVTYRLNWELRPVAPASAPSTVGKFVLASPSAAVLGEEYLRTIATDATRAIPRIVDFLETVPEVDPARIGIAGTSSSGFIVLQAVARDRRLAVAVALAACGDYHRFLRYSSMGMEGEQLSLAPQYDRWLRAQEIVRRPARLVHAALLMVNRDRDPMIPFACVGETARVLRRAYRRAGVPERFRFTVIEGERHALDQRDTDETMAWLYRWLKTPGALGPPAPR